MAIGDTLRRSREVRLVALALALGCVAIDLSLHLSSIPWVLQARVPLSWFALLSFGALAQWDRESLGLRLTPIQGWGYWFKLTAALALVTLALIAGAFGLFYLLGRELVGPSLPWEPDVVLRWLVTGCLEAPLYEETIYRFALCVGVVAFAGRWPAIIVSGLVFAWLHFVYGNPGPDNFVAGYVLAWAFLRSGSLAVPIVLHALGNLFVLIVLLIL